MGSEKEDLMRETKIFMEKQGTKFDQSKGWKQKILGEDRRQNTRRRMRHIEI